MIFGIVERDCSSTKLSRSRVLHYNTTSFLKIFWPFEKDGQTRVYRVFLKIKLLQGSTNGTTFYFGYS